MTQLPARGDPDFGRAVRELRENCGMTRPDLARATGFSVSSIKKWEDGTAPNASTWQVLETFFAAEEGAKAPPLSAHAVEDLVAELRRRGFAVSLMMGG